MTFGLSVCLPIRLRAGYLINYELHTALTFEPVH